jgi:hypothetical protein
MIEVLKQMQEALREYHYYTIDAGLPNQSMLNKGYAAYQAGLKAIAELESQEPVAWVAEDVCEGQYIDGRPRKIWWECEKSVGTAFYTHPPQRTEERNFCQRCGKRLGKRLDGIDSIHTCTPPMEKNT